jgi:hypothetical protein
MSDDLDGLKRFNWKSFRVVFAVIFSSIVRGKGA